DVLDLDPDAVFLEVTLLDPNQGGHGRDRARQRDADRMLLRLCGGRARQNRERQQRNSYARAHRPVSSPVFLLRRQRQPGSWLALFSTANGPSFRMAKST